MESEYRANLITHLEASFGDRPETQGQIPKLQIKLKEILTHVPWPRHCVYMVAQFQVQTVNNYHKEIPVLGN